MVEAVVTFPKARGRTSEKVFKLASFELLPGEARPLSGRVRLHAMSTRTHFPGRHEVQIQVNGHRMEGGSFEVEDRAV